ncbi:MlaD family protein [Mycobacterium sp. 1274756.6]|uniref:MCE family protein n=1 Tax=Mycobacterium sp. 1274756.6 TaxID=1834076 RepID=UPI002571097D|nr:MlaD family protein [Mycobacterium sp. 1274756.6]
MLNRRILLQLAVFVVVSMVCGTVMTVRYMELPDLLFGAGHYRVTVELAESGGLYEGANVTYRGVDVGRVRSVDLSGSGVVAVLSLKSGQEVPSDLDAHVHSQTAIGEQFIELTPRGGSSRPLQDGDVIGVDRTSIPVDVNELLDGINTGLGAIPREDLQVLVDESYIAVNNLGPELSRLVDASATLAIDGYENLDSVIALIEQSGPLMASQIDTSTEIHRWAASMAEVAGQLQANDEAVTSLLQGAPSAFDEVRQLFDRLQPTLPILLANLVSVGKVAVTYQPNLEHILVLLPPLVEVVQGALIANRFNKNPYAGAYLSFNLNLNLPPPCLTGFLPPNQARAASLLDFPDRPDGDLYCRIPQDAMFNVRGARNLPCVTRPGKRAPTVEMCESDDEYLPLNDGYNWKGDPNATVTGQGVPQLRTETPPAALPQTPGVAVAEYDPNTGSYIGPDGKLYTQADLARAGDKEKTWQTMILPPGTN